MVQKCSGYARQRMGPKLMNCCKSEKVDAQEDGNMLKKFRFLKKAEFLLTKKGVGKLTDKRKGSQERNIGDSGKTWGDRGALPNEDGDQLREYKAMHEENFLSSWLREDVKEGKAKMQGWRKEAGEDKDKHGKREVEREEEKTVIKRRCVNPFSSDIFEQICPVVFRCVGLRFLCLCLWFTAVLVSPSSVSVL